MVVSQQLKTRAELPWLYYPRENSVRIINAHRGGGSGPADLGDEVLILRGPTGITDQSAEGNDGTYVGGMGTTSDTGSGGTLAFLSDGTDDELTVAHDVSLNFGATGFWGICGWVKTSSVRRETIVSKISGTDGWYLDLLATGHLRFRYGLGTSIYLDSSTTVNDGNWHHVGACKISNSLTRTDAIRIYIDGVDRTGTNGSDGINAAQDTSYDIGYGRPAGGFASRFTGRMDDMRVVPRVITASNFSDLYSGGR